MYKTICVICKQYACMCEYALNKKIDRIYEGCNMKQVITKQPVLRMEYGGNVYIGETDTHFLITIIDCEGVKHSVVHALSKEQYKIKE
jgi:hypothetical protein